MDWAFQWIQKNGGIDTEEDWGYYSGWGFGTWCNARKQKDRWVQASFGSMRARVSVGAA
jgi:hypothetical protein